MSPGSLPPLKLSVFSELLDTKTNFTPHNYVVSRGFAGRFWRTLRSKLGETAILD